MIKTVKSIFFFAIFIGLCLFSLYGVFIYSYQIYAPIGNYKLSVFDNGLAVYQKDRPFFYTISPVNDYTLDHAGIRNSLIISSDLEQKKVKSNFEKSKWESIYIGVLHYFGLWKPSIQFTSDKEVIYDTDLFRNQVIINKKLGISGNPDIKYWGTTFTFKGGSILFDEKKILYSYQYDSDVDLLKKYFGLNLSKVINVGRFKIPGKIIFILNPNLSGVLEIKANMNQDIWINKDARMIELEEKVQEQINGFYQTSLEVDVLDDIGEVSKKL